MSWASIKEILPRRGVEVLLWRKHSAPNGQNTFSHIFDENLNAKEIRAFCNGASVSHWQIVIEPEPPVKRSTYVKGLIRRRDLIMKRYPRISDDELKELEALEKELFADGKIFEGTENEADREASDLIRRAAKLLKEKGDHDCKFIQLEEFGLQIAIATHTVDIVFKNAELQMTHKAKQFSELESVTFEKKP